MLVLPAPVARPQVLPISASRSPSNFEQSNFPKSVLTAPKAPAPHTASSGVSPTLGLPAQQKPTAQRAVHLPVAPVRIAREESPKSPKLRTGRKMTFVVRSPRERPSPVVAALPKMPAFGKSASSPSLTDLASPPRSTSMPGSNSQTARTGVQTSRSQQGGSVFLNALRKFGRKQRFVSRSEESLDSIARRVLTHVEAEDGAGHNRDTVSDSNLLQWDMKSSAKADSTNRLTLSPTEARSNGNDGSWARKHLLHLPRPRSSSSEVSSAGGRSHLPPTPDGQQSKGLCGPQHEGEKFVTPITNRTEKGKPPVRGILRPYAPVRQQVAKFGFSGRRCYDVGRHIPVSAIGEGTAKKAVKFGDGKTVDVTVLHYEQAEVLDCPWFDKAGQQPISFFGRARAPSPQQPSLEKTHVQLNSIIDSVLQENEGSDSKAPESGETATEFVEKIKVELPLSDEEDNNDQDLSVEELKAAFDAARTDSAPSVAAKRSSAPVSTSARCSRSSSTGPFRASNRASVRAARAASFSPGLTIMAHKML